MSWFKKKATNSTDSDSSDIKTELVSVYRQAIIRGVPLTKLNEKVTRLVMRIQVSESFEDRDTQEKVENLKRQLPLIVKIGAFSLPVLFIVVGLFLVGNAALPLAQYFAVSSKILANDTDLISPLPEDQLIDISPTVISSTNFTMDGYDNTGINIDGFSRPTFIDSQLDYTNLANWFNASQFSALTQVDGPTTEYILEIPKLGISNAKVAIGGTDLDQSLIQYPGTANPGAPGAPVIFGHSVLRQFYNPSEQNPNRYISIFSTIMTLKSGDEIIVNHDGVKYRYIMKEKTEVNPEDVHILMQNYDQRQLKLVTCTPEGTYLRRGVVVADLVTN
jgi:LPXTG-site transpeptidase (sortase) family protein